MRKIVLSRICFDHPTAIIYPKARVVNSFLKSQTNNHFMIFERNKNTLLYNIPSLSFTYFHEKTFGKFWPQFFDKNDELMKMTKNIPFYVSTYALLQNFHIQKVNQSKIRLTWSIPKTGRNVYFSFSLNIVFSLCFTFQFFHRK